MKVKGHRPHAERIGQAERTDDTASNAGNRDGSRPIGRSNSAKDRSNVKPDCGIYEVNPWRETPS